MTIQPHRHPDPPSPGVRANDALVVQPEHRSATVVDPETRLVVGSSPDADLRLPNMTGQHVVFHPVDPDQDAGEPGGWYCSPFTTDVLVLPAGSGDWEAMPGRWRLNPGDRIRAGAQTLIIVPTGG